MTEVSTFDSECSANLLARSIESAEARRSDFVRAIPPQLLKREDEIQAKLSKDNSSKRNKLRKIYSLLTDLDEIAKPYLACSKGCSSCCKMNVMVSQAEANLIAEKTGLKSKQLVHSELHSPDEFLGIPCVFLKEESCSIYEVRPFVCRKHVSFDTSPYWCDPERTLRVGMPMIEFSGAANAFFDVTGKDSGGVYADIRDFFT